MIQTGALIREGKTKRIYATDDPRKAVCYFKDEAIAYRGLKRGRILGKGEVNNVISRTFFQLLRDNGIENHYIEQVDSRQSLIWRCDMLAVAVKVRNRAAGSVIERLGVPEGTPLSPPVVEFIYRDGAYDRLVNLSHILALKLATREEVRQVTETALRVNEIIGDYMRTIGIELIDFQLEFGRFEGRILVADEISPDVARFWDARTHEPMDIDCFRHDIGDAEEAYHELLHRMMGVEG